MENQDIKKLITAFLILAVMVSSFSLLFSSSSSNLSFEILSSEKNQKEQYLRNAFVESVPVDNLSWFFGENSAGNYNGLSRRPTDNLTDNLAQVLAQEIINTNPDPQKLKENQVFFDSQKINNLVSGQISNFDTKKLLDEVAARTEKEVKKAKIKKDYTAIDVKNYLEKLETLSVTLNSFSNNLNYNLAEFASDKTQTTFQLEKLVKSEEFIEVAKSARLILGEKSLGLKNLEIPSPFAEFHKILLTYVEINKILAKTAGDYQSDPFKALLVFKNPQEINNYQLMLLQKLNSEATKLKKISLISNNKRISLLLTKLLVKIAEAQSGGEGGGGEVVDLPVNSQGFSALKAVPSDDVGNKITHIINEVSNFLHKFKYFWTVGKQIAMDTLKNRLMHQLTQQIVRWVQGGGKPQFITDWRGFLNSAANVAAGRLIETYVPGLCRSIAPLVKINLQKVYVSDPPTPSCTLDQVVENIQDFYSDFMSGGWRGYSETILPSGNFFGSLFEANLKVSQAAEEEKEGEKSNVESNQGFKGFRRCKKSTKVEAMIADELVIKGNPDYVPGSWHCKSNTECYAEICEPNPDGTSNWEQTTPGGAAASALYKSLNAPLEQIINAQDFENIVAAVVNAAITKLMDSLIKDPNSRGLANLDPTAKKVIGGDSSSDVCNALGGNAEDVAKCQESGEVFDNSDITTDSYQQNANELLNDAKNLLKLREAEENYLQIASSTASSALALIVEIRQATSTCTLSEENDKDLAEYETNLRSIMSQIEQRLTVLGPLIEDLKNFINDLENLINNGNLTTGELSRKISEFQNKFLDPTAIQKTQAAAQLADTAVSYENGVKSIQQEACNANSSP